MISHDTELLAAVVNKVWFLDATRGEADVYNMNWKRYLERAPPTRSAVAANARTRRRRPRSCTPRR